MKIPYSANTDFKEKSARHIPSLTPLKTPSQEMLVGSESESRQPAQQRNVSIRILLVEEYRSQNSVIRTGLQLPSIAVS